MRFLRDLSLAYKTPLRISVLVSLTAVLVTAALVLRERDELRRDLIGHSESVARVLAKTLIEPVAHDDAWRAFEIINAPFHPAPGDAASQAPEIVMLLDPKQMVYVSTRPTEYPMLSNPAYIDPEFANVQKAIAETAGSEPAALVAPVSNRLYMVMPIISDGVNLGTLVMGYSGAVFRPRFFALMRRAGIVTAAVLLVLLPMGWYFGRRIAQPLVALAGAMGKVGPQLPDELHYAPSYRGRDEIGRLGMEFQRMVSELRNKEALEKQMIASDRLAAIGRLTAAIAHEINNPLGGMLNAINTFKRHGPADPMTAKTLALVERGLLQIKETVAALLVEARVESHSLTRQDIEDTHTLVLPDAQAKDAEFSWTNEVTDPLPLPSTLTRQVLINLLLNAVQAIERGGCVQCRTLLAGGALRIEVSNDGRHVPKDKLHYLFEPFSLLSHDGHGLGLWVTYQIVQQLGGDIRVSSEPQQTTFTVVLPLETPHEPEPRADAVSG
jgi:two-component system, NtrC family, sensor kinase